MLTVRRALAAVVFLAVFGLPAGAQSSPVTAFATTSAVNCPTDQACSRLSHVHISLDTIGGQTTETDYYWQSDRSSCASDFFRPTGTVSGQFCRTPSNATAVTGAVQIGGDIGGTPASPTVTALSHLGTNTLPNVPSAAGALPPINGGSATIQLAAYGLSTSGANAAANTMAINSACSAAASSGYPIVGYKAVIPINAEISCSADFFGNGITIDATGAAGSFPDSAAWYVAGSAADLGALSVQILSGANTFTLSVTPPAAVKFGAIVYVVDTTNGSFNTARNSYFAGEAVRVLSVSGNTVTTENPFRYTYPTAHLAAIKVSLISPVNARVSGLNVIGVSGTSNVVPIQFEFAGPEASLTDSCGVQSFEAGIYIGHSYGMSLRHICADTTNGGGTPSVNYGVALVNDVNVTVSDSNLIGLRHGATIGGAGGTNYDITNHNSGFNNSYISTQAYGQYVNAADAHGDSDGIFYTNNRIDGGVQFGGANNTVTNNTILFGRLYGYSQFCVYAVDLQSMQHDASGNSCYGRTNQASSSSGYGSVLDFDTSGNQIGASLSVAGTFDFSHTTASMYVAANGSNFYVPWIEARMSANSVSSGDVNLDLHGSTFTLTGTDGSAYTGGIAVYGQIVSSHCQAASTRWSNVDASGLKGDLGLDLQCVKNVKASGDFFNNLNSSSFLSSLKPISVIDATGIITISDMTALGGPSNAILLDYYDVRHPIVRIDNVLLSSGAFSGTQSIYVLDGVSTLSDINVGANGPITCGNLSGNVMRIGGLMRSDNSYSVGALCAANFGTFTANGTSEVTTTNSLVDGDSIITVSPVNVGAGAYISKKTNGTSFGTKSPGADTNVYNYRIDN